MTAIAPDVEPAALEAVSLSKRYGATNALVDVSISLRRGEVTALAGGNGAGKSTLIRLLTGVEKSDGGQILRGGVPVTLNSRQDATRLGIFCVFQDQPFVPAFQVKHQLYLGYENHFRRGGIVSDSAMTTACAELLADLNLTSIQPDQRMSDLSPAARELVALAGVIAVSRLLEVEHPVILLDEPTSALSAEELEFLVEFIQRLKQRSAIVFVSHRVTEVLQWSDAVYVLRDARNADYMTRETASDERVHRAMGGQPKRLTAPVAVAQPAAVEREPQSPGGEALSASGIRLHPRAAAFDLSVWPGETVGIAGVEGSGKEALLRLLAGIVTHEGASREALRVQGIPRRSRIREMLNAGVVYLSGERHRDGIFGRLSIWENMAVSRRTASRDRTPFVRQRREQARAEELVRSLSVKTAGVVAPLASLSGGNQQKVLLGRCLELSPKVLLLDNVTRGVDIGAKETIYQVLRALAERGCALVLAGDDLDELAANTDRVIVLKAGQVAKELDNADREVDPLEILAAMV